MVFIEQIFIVPNILPCFNLLSKIFHQQYSFKKCDIFRTKSTNIDNDLIMMFKHEIKVHASRLAGSGSLRWLIVMMCGEFNNR